MNPLCETCRIRLEFGTDPLTGRSQERCRCHGGRWRALQRSALSPEAQANERSEARRLLASARVTVTVPCSVCGVAVPVPLRVADPEVMAGLRRYCSATCRTVGRRALNHAARVRRLLKDAQEGAA